MAPSRASGAAPARPAGACRWPGQKSARNLATGKPHPRRWPLGWPNASCNRGCAASRSSTRRGARPGGRARSIGPSSPSGHSRRSAKQGGGGPPGSRPRGTVGGIGEVPSAEVDHVRTGGVAVKDLKDKQIDGRHRIEHPLAPRVFLLPTCLLDRLARKPVGEVLPDTAQDGDNPYRRGKTPSRSGWLCYYHQIARSPSLAQDATTCSLGRIYALSSRHSDGSSLRGACPRFETAFY